MDAPSFASEEENNNHNSTRSVPNSSSSNIVLCYYCQGSTVCYLCEGKKKHERNKCKSCPKIFCEENCRSCKETGMCTHCGGTGEMSSKKYDREKNAYYYKCPTGCVCATIGWVFLILSCLLFGSLLITPPFFGCLLILPLVVLFYICTVGCCTWTVLLRQRRQQANKVKKRVRSTNSL